MQTMYRIFLMANSNGLAETLAILAAKSNGNKDGLYSLSDIQDVAKGQIIIYPSSNADTTCELLDENTLHLYRKIGNDYETVLILEKIQVMDILEELAPTVHRQNNPL